MRWDKTLFGVVIVPVLAIAPALAQTSSKATIASAPAASASAAAVKSAAPVSASPPQGSTAAPAAAGPTLAAATHPATPGGMDGATYAVRLRDLEQRIDELKEQIRRSHTRLSLSPTPSCRAAGAGSRSEHPVPERACPAPSAGAGALRARRRGAVQQVRRDRRAGRAGRDPDLQRLDTARRSHVQVLLQPPGQRLRRVLVPARATTSRCARATRSPRSRARRSRSGHRLREGRASPRRSKSAPRFASARRSSAGVSGTGAEPASPGPRRPPTLPHRQRIHGIFGRHRGKVA